MIFVCCLFVLIGAMLGFVGGRALAPVPRPVSCIIQPADLRNGPFAVRGGGPVLRHDGAIRGARFG
jgi:hypothetical protein